MVDPAVQLRGIEIAGDDQHRIVRPVIGGVEGAHVLDRRRVEILDAANPGPRIGMHIVGDHRQIEVEEPAVGLGEHPAPELLLHHVALGVEEALLDDQRAHPLRLRPEQALQMVGRDDLVIIGVVVVGRGVVEAADILGQPVELLGHHVPRRLEHHMFEQMREAGASARIVLGADIVPDLHRDVGGVGVADRIDAQSVGQRSRLIGDRDDLGSRGGRLGEGRRGERRESQSGGGRAQDGLLHWVLHSPGDAILLRPGGNAVKRGGE